MPSNARATLDQRLKDIEQLLQAHTVLTQFQRAKKAAKKAGGDLAQISLVVANLVNKPGRGRRSEVGAINRAAIVLLSAHLQGYIEDAFSETAKRLLRKKVPDIEALVAQALAGFSNPQAYRIDRLFASIGIAKVTNRLTWQGTTNESVKKRLTAYIKLRNNIAHGKLEPVQKPKVTAFQRFVRLFADELDELLESYKSS